MTHLRKPAPRRREPRAFSIIETLVAIAILLIATTGPMVFAQQSLRAANLARDQVTAFYLAQDAMEFVKHVRDENSLRFGDREAWLEGLENCEGAASDLNEGCQISTPEWSGGSTDNAVAPCGFVEGVCPLYEVPAGDGIGKFYGIFNQAGELSRFSRRVRIMTTEGGNDAMLETEEVRVEVLVTWRTLGIDGERQVLVREHIYNWIQ